MPTDQPSNAADPEDLPRTDARDDRTAASVLADADLDDAPGGGGLGGAAAVPGTARATGGAAPNSPLADAMVAGTGDGGGSDGDPAAEKEARTRMEHEAPDERHPSSL